MSWNHSLLLQVKQQPHSYSQYVVGLSRATSAMKPLTCWSTSSPVSRSPSSLVLASSAIVSCSFSYINKQDLPLCLCYQQPRSLFQAVHRTFHNLLLLLSIFDLVAKGLSYCLFMKSLFQIYLISSFIIFGLSVFYPLREAVKKIEINRFFYKCKSGTKL